jgi:dipeptidyl-peptidase 4
MKQNSFWRTWVVVGLLAAMPAIVTAQEAELTLDDLFATPKLTGTTPSRPVWAPNSEHFAFSWSEPGIPGVAYGYPQAMGRKRVLVPMLHPRQ